MALRSLAPPKTPLPLAPMAQGPEAVLTASANPVGLLAAVVIPGSIGTVMMSVSEGARGGKIKDHEERMDPVRLVREARRKLDDAIRKGDFDEISQWTRDIYFALGPDALADYTHSIVRLTLLELKALEKFARKMLNRKLTPADWRAFQNASQRPDLPIRPGDSVAEFWAALKQSVSQRPSN